jgi:signal transduction histidine kinase
MKSFVKIVLFLLLSVSSSAQNRIYEEPTRAEADSLLRVLNTIPNDTIKMDIYKKLTVYYLETNGDSAIYFGNQQLKIATRFDLKLWKAIAYDYVGYSYYNTGNYSLALYYLLEAFKIADDNECEKNIWRISEFSKEKDPRTARLNVLSTIYDDLGTLYGVFGNHEKQISSYLKAQEIGESTKDPLILTLVNMDLGNAYLDLNSLESAFKIEKKALKYSKASGYTKYNGMIYSAMGNIYAKKEKPDSAKIYFVRAIKESKVDNNLSSLALAYSSMANLCLLTKEPDSVIVYASKSLKVYAQTKTTLDLPKIYSTLSSGYKLKHNMDSAYSYLKMAIAAQDSLYNADKIKQFQNIGFNEGVRLEQMEVLKIQLQNKVRLYFFLAGIAIFLLITVILYRNNKQKQKANKILEHTLEDLKSAQFQLIQSEKMASIGQLTKGIVDRILNPLNYINNFSLLTNDLSIETEEILNSLQGKIDNDTYEDLKDLLKMIETNVLKVNEHGSSASRIVKGMEKLLKERSTTFVPTDINTLVESHLGIALQQYTVDNKDFKVEIIKDFDNKSEKINVLPSELGSVIVNTFENACYAVDEKMKKSKDFKPEITVSTHFSDEEVKITVHDNGTGIPEPELKKLFAPFFTTKPTSKGTGLGLYMNMDIVKSHKGTIEVESKDGEFTVFIIKLPKKEEVKTE